MVREQPSIMAQIGAEETLEKAQIFMPHLMQFQKCSHRNQVFWKNFGTPKYHRLSKYTELVKKRKVFNEPLSNNKMFNFQNLICLCVSTPELRF